MSSMHSPQMLMSSEGKGTGLQWSTLFSRARPGDPLTMGAVWIMFLVDIVLYCLIIAYIDKIAPGKFGVAKKWYFPFTPEFWSSKNQVNNVVLVSDKDGNDVRDISMFEMEPKAEAGIEGNNIKKDFKKVYLSSTHNFVKYGYSSLEETLYMLSMESLFQPIMERSQLYWGTMVQVLSCKTKRKKTFLSDQGKPPPCLC